MCSFNRTRKGPPPKKSIISLKKASSLQVKPAHIHQTTKEFHKPMNEWNKSVVIIRPLRINCDLYTPLSLQSYLFLFSPIIVITLAVLFFTRVGCARVWAKLALNFSSTSLPNVIHSRITFLHDSPCCNVSFWSQDICKLWSFSVAAGFWSIFFPLLSRFKFICSEFGLQSIPLISSPLYLYRLSLVQFQ